MPQRTNEFQHLVKLIHETLAPAGAKVTESAMVEVPGFGQMREIDVLIESVLSPYRIKVGVEAKDHNRKLNITDIEAIIGKYRGPASVIVDKVVIVSRRGFAKKAVEKAKSTGIELMTLTEVSGSDWKQMVTHPTVPTENQIMKFQFAPHVARVELFAVSGTPTPPSEAITRGKLICNCCGKDNNTPLSYANHYATKHVMIDPRFVERFNNAFAPDRPNVCGKVNVPIVKYRLAFDGKDYRMQAMHFHIHATRASVPMEFKAYEVKGDSVGSKIIQRATTKLPGGSLDMFFPDGLHSKKIAVDFNLNCF